MRFLADIQGSKNNDDTPMDVDSSDHARPPKRHRLSLEGESPGDKGRRRDPAADLQEAREKFNGIEIRIDSLENHLNAWEGEMKEELNERLELRFEDVFNERENRLNNGDDSVRSQLQRVESHIDQTADAIKELCGDMEDIMKREDTRDREIELLRKENVGFAGRFLQWEQKLKEYDDARQQDRNTIAALSATLSAYMKKPMTPPGSPRIPSPEDVLEAVREPLLEKVRSHLQPILEDFRSTLEIMIREHHEEIYTTIWQRLYQTRRVVDSVARIVDPADRLA